MIAFPPPKSKQRIKRAQHGPCARELGGAGTADEKKPDEHDRPEKAPRPPAAVALEQEQSRKQEEHHGYNSARPRHGGRPAEQGAAAFGSGCQRQRRGQDGIRQKRGAAQHRREHKPGRAIPHQGVQGKVPPFAAVVGAQQEQNALARCQQQQ